MKRSQIRRSRMKSPKLTPKRQERRERRADWAVAVKRRDRSCRFDAAAGRTTLAWPHRTTDAHHMLAKSQGGPDELWNGIGLCHHHHMWVHDHRLEAQALGLLAHVGDCSPVARPGEGGER